MHQKNAIVLFMVVEVDQSVKIEQSGETVLAFANGQKAAIVIPQRVKRAAFATLIAKGKSRNTATLLLFAACLYLLLKNQLKKMKKIIIDVEYEGKDTDIKAFLLRYIRRTTSDFDEEMIVFRRIGKHSPADQKAREVRKRTDKDYRKIVLKELLRVVT